MTGNENGSTATAGRTVGGAADKVLRVLEAVAEPGGPHRLGDITLRAGILKSSAHRLAVVLVAEGYLVALGNGLYGVGPQLRALAAQVTGDANGGLHDLLQDLQQSVGGHTVHLAVRSGDHAVYIHKIDGDRPYQMASRVGMHLPLHCTSIGKAILSRLPAAEVDGVVARTGLPARTPTTITDRADLHRALDEVRAQGFAVDDEENEATIRCIAVPVTDSAGQLFGGLSVSTVTFTTSRDELRSFVEPLTRTAVGVAQVLA
jgi:IclR family acetate operon transcriptional repressor